MEEQIKNKDQEIRKLIFKKIKIVLIKPFDILEILYFEDEDEKVIDSYYMIHLQNIIKITKEENTITIGDTINEYIFNFNEKTESKSFFIRIRNEYMDFFKRINNLSMDIQQMNKPMEVKNEPGRNN